MVLRVFGRQKGMEARIGKGRMLEVAILAAVISLGTAIAEETCFRGQLVSGLAMSHDPATSVVLGAVLFGLAHVNLGSSLKDNMVTIGLHTMTGAGFGTAFILGGGNLAGCIGEAGMQGGGCFRARALSYFALRHPLLTKTSPEHCYTSRFVIIC